MTADVNREESELLRKVGVAYTTLLRVEELGCGVREPAGKIH